MTIILNMLAGIGAMTIAVGIVTPIRQWFAARKARKDWDKMVADLKAMAPPYKPETARDEAAGKGLN